MKYDQHENCAKCGYPGKTVEWKRLPEGDEAPLVSPFEVLLITCSRCRFQWFRDCLDKEEA